MQIKKVAYQSLLANNLNQQKDSTILQLVSLSHNDTFLPQWHFAYLSKVRKVLWHKGLNKKKKHDGFVSKPSCLFGAGGGTRTRTLVATEPKSVESANSTTPANIGVVPQSGGLGTN